MSEIEVLRDLIIDTFYEGRHQTGDLNEQARGGKMSSKGTRGYCGDCHELRHNCECPWEPNTQDDTRMLKRNVLIVDELGFKGEWVAIPREDFDILRGLLSIREEGGK